MLTIQYLEASPVVMHLSADVVVDRLRRAAGRLQFSHLLIGWHLPRSLLEACRLEAERLGVRFLQWHPLLTGGINVPDSQVVGPRGEYVPGFMNLPDFTFACPNHPGVQEALSRKLETLINSGIYQGFFLDRIRFPSPAADPANCLGCFCQHCHDKAADLGLDLEAVRQEVIRLARDGVGTLILALALLKAQPSSTNRAAGELLSDFLDFRSRSVMDLAANLAAQLRHAGFEVGLDCYSPSLTRMVGQDLASLSAHADWIKIMSYAHTRGPAGPPFELGGVYDFLRSGTGWDEAKTLRWMGQALGYPLPETRKDLDVRGLTPLALRREVEAGIKESAAPVLAGVELVEVAGVTKLSSAQIRADLESVKEARPAGLSLSWDLWRMPLARLDLVREVYLGQSA